MHGEKINKYLNGELSPEEMHALEKEALNDPFLADAIEGMENMHKEHGTNKFKEDVDYLKNKIANKNKTRRIYWASAAATLIVLVTAVAVMLSINKKGKEKAVVAAVTKLPQEAESVISNDTIVMEKVGQGTIKNDNRKRKEQEAPVPLVFKDTVIEFKKSDWPVKDKKTEDRRTVSLPAETSPDPLKTMQGRVPGIEVKEEEVVSSSVYYERKKSSEELNNSVDKYSRNIKPVTGWKNYYNYLNNNKQRDRSDTSKTGYVIISFTVNKKDSISDYKIEKSLSAFYDQEAIRLIKEGPKWKLKKGKTERVSLRLSF